jgi:very-short-patch-repair endonuclease
VAADKSSNIVEVDKVSFGARKVKQPLDPILLAFARALRQSHSDAERLMWAILRGRRFCGFKFRRQHPVGRYILDFYCDEAKLAIELDGGQHNSDEARRQDAVRSEFLSKQRIDVLRFWNHELLEDLDAVLEAIHKTLTAR